MKILVVGGGGREHALVWKLKQNPNVEVVACAPGNAGISGIGWCLDIGAEDIENLAVYAETIAGGPHGCGAGSGFNQRHCRYVSGKGFAHIRTPTGLRRKSREARYFQRT